MILTVPARGTRRRATPSPSSVADTSPRACAARAERQAVLPSAPGETFAGYGVMGLPFASGHVLALRAWAASSIGPAYRSVWHRTPAGRWTFVADVAPELSCPRYAGAAVDAVLVGRVDVAWTAPDALVVEVPAIALRWTLRVTDTPITRAYNALRPLLPVRLLDGAAFQALLGAVARWALGTGPVPLRGRMPNGQRYRASPRRLWLVADAHAVLAGEDLGRPAPLARQARLGDFRIPQRGVLAIGAASFEAFDADRHAPSLTRPG